MPVKTKAEPCNLTLDPLKELMLHLFSRTIIPTQAKRQCLEPILVISDSGCDTEDLQNCLVLDYVEHPDRMVAKACISAPKTSNCCH